MGENDADRMRFLFAAIQEHQASEAFRFARDAELYYNGENPTINRYEKIIYDLKGRAHRNLFTANHKIASSFFRFAVDQENSYLLGNGVTFKNAATKPKLGTRRKPFDLQLLKVSKRALIDGVAFGFWNLDHIEVFSLREFVPLPDEEDGALKAGIRFWQIAGDKPLRVTLYEPDGCTEYIRRKDADMAVLTPKRAYIVYTVGSALERSHGETVELYENYPGFPIVPLRNNDAMRSELRGRRNTLDALDLATSNMVNNVDEGNLIYWVLTNCGGMDDLDDMAFIEQLHITHVAHVDGSADGARAEAHTLEAPFTGTQTTIDMLTKRLYTDFQCFDASAVSAGNQTATAIRASYVPLDLKVDQYEAQVTEFVDGILALAGIDDEPTYTRNQIISRQEDAQTVLLGAEYLDEEYITAKLLTILGDADQIEAVHRRRAAEEEDRAQTAPAVPPSQQQAPTAEDVTGNG